MSKGHSLMRIGELAAKSKLSIRAIHYYEEVGLISPSGRTAGGFRLYSDGHLEQLNLIGALKAMDTPLCKIKELMRGQNPDEESQLRKVKSRIFQHNRFMDDLQCTIDILSECERKECNKRPTASNCRCCEVVLDRDFLPLNFKTIYV